VSRKQISCATTLAAEDVRSWPDVVAVERDAERLRITVVLAEPVLRRLLTSDHRVSDVEVRRAGLSEAFVELTKEAA
jgi:ABC-2 type transport system ATP-binding protein